MLRRAGIMLPPPLDDYCNNISASAAKPIVKNTSTNAASTGKGSPPNGSSGKTDALPAADSWGMRSSSQPQVASSAYSNGPTKPKPETDLQYHTFFIGSCRYSSGFHSAQFSDIGKKAMWNEESQPINGKVKPDPLKPAKLNSGTDFRPTTLDKPATSDATSATLSDQPACSLGHKHNEWSKTMTSLMQCNRGSE